MWLENTIITTKDADRRVSNTQTFDEIAALIPNYGDYDQAYKRDELIFEMKVKVIKTRLCIL